jgi:hypothetical protein
MDKMMSDNEDMYYTITRSSSGWNVGSNKIIPVYLASQNGNYTSEFLKWNNLYETNPKQFEREYPHKSESYENKTFKGYVDLGDKHPNAFYKSKLNKPIYFRNCIFTDSTVVVLTLSYSEVHFIDCTFDINEICFKCYQVQFDNCNIKCDSIGISTTICQLNNTIIKSKNDIEFDSLIVMFDQSNITAKHIQFSRIDNFDCNNSKFNYKSIAFMRSIDNVYEYFNIPKYDTNKLLVCNQNYKGLNLNTQEYTVVLNCNITSDNINICCEALHINEGITLKAHRSISMNCFVVGKGFKLISNKIDITKTNLEISHEWAFECKGKFLFNKSIIPNE